MAKFGQEQPHNQIFTANLERQIVIRTDLKAGWKFMLVGALVCFLARAFHLEYSHESVDLHVLLSFPSQILGGAICGWIAWFAWEDRKKKLKRDDA